MMPRDRRILRLRVLVIAATVVTFAVAGYLYIERRVSGQYLISLEEALWTCDAPLENFYPPGSPESAGVITALASTGFDVKTKEYRYYVCLRILGRDAPPDTVALWGPFDPHNPKPFITSQR